MEAPHTNGVPRRIARAAARRMVKAAPQREAVLAAVSGGRPLDAEPNRARKIRFVERFVGVTRPVAKEIVDYVKPTDLNVGGVQLLRAAAMQDGKASFLDVFFVELARSAANAVCRLSFESGAARGTGFLISKDLMLTNNHVIPTELAAAELKAEFNFELNPDGQGRPVMKFALDPARFFLTDPEGRLDFTVIALGAPADVSSDASKLGSCPLIDADDKHIMGLCVNVVEHPAGDPKQVVLRENRLVTRLPTVLHYLASATFGSSGSPVFNDKWEVVALHHVGGASLETHLPDGTPVPDDVNEGIRISAIVRHLRKELGKLAGEKRDLLLAALQSAT